MSPALLAEAFLLICLSSAGVNYLLRSSAYMEHAREWWWRRAPRSDWALRENEKPGRFWPLRVSKAWVLVYADEQGFPKYRDEANTELALAQPGVPLRTAWFSRDGIMFGRVLTCRMCFGFWCTALTSIPFLWPGPGEWDWRSLAVRVLVVFGAWPVAVLVNRLFEAEGGKQ